MDYYTQKTLWGICAIACATLYTTNDAEAQKSKQRRDFIEMSIAPESPNWQYNVGEKAYANVNIRYGGIPAQDVWVHYEVGDDMMAPQKTDSVHINNGVARIEIGTRSEPGFRFCKVSTRVWDKERTELLKVGYEPDKIESHAKAPKDFDSFWQRSIADARKIDLAPELEELTELSTNDIAVYKLRLTVGPENRHIYGYLSKPRDGKQHPVMFCPPGAGVKIDTYNDVPSSKGYIYLSIEIHGMDPSLDSQTQKAWRDSLNNYMAQGIDSPDTYYYKNVYIGCVRCIDYLCSLPEWDGKNVFVTGGSQGGALTIVTAALHEKVTALAAFYPALSDLTGFLHNSAGGWPRFFSDRYAGKKGHTVGQNTTKTMSYYDASLFAQRLKAPGFYNYGYEDDVCSPTSVAACINNISATKIIIVTPTSGHWRFPEINECAYAFFENMKK